MGLAPGLMYSLETSHPSMGMRLSPSRHRHNHCEMYCNTFKMSIVVFFSSSSLSFIPSLSPLTLHPLSLSLSLSLHLPSLSLTHWKQDLFMVNTPLSVARGDVLEGKICIRRNRLWRRHLKVTIQYIHSPTSPDQPTQVLIQSCTYTTYCDHFTPFLFPPSFLPSFLPSFPPSLPPFLLHLLLSPSPSLPSLSSPPPPLPSLSFPSSLRNSKRTLPCGNSVN